MSLLLRSEALLKTEGRGDFGRRSLEGVAGTHVSAELYAFSQPNNRTTIISVLVS